MGYRRGPFGKSTERQPDATLQNKRWLSRALSGNEPTTGTCSRELAPRLRKESAGVCTSNSRSVVIRLRSHTNEGSEQINKTNLGDSLDGMPEQADRVLFPHSLMFPERVMSSISRTRPLPQEFSGQHAVGTMLASSSPSCFWSVLGIACRLG